MENVLKMYLKCTVLYSIDKKSVLVLYSLDKKSVLYKHNVTSQ
jgi:hypothetical protein